MSFAERKGISGPPHTPTPPGEPEVFCQYRSWTPVGSIKCSCSNQPEVFACSEPFVVSGFCMPEGFDKMPADGPIVMESGAKIVPKDERMKTFIPWVLKEGEQTADWQVIACRKCPKRVEPPPHIVRLQQLHIQGDFYTDTGHADIMHLTPNVKPPVELLPTPAGLKACVAHLGRVELGELLEATECRLLIVYGQATHIHAVKTAMSGRPELLVWFVPYEQQMRQEEVEGVSYGLPDDLAAEANAAKTAAYGKAMERILG